MIKVDQGIFSGRKVLSISHASAVYHERNHKITLSLSKRNRDQQEKNFGRGKNLFSYAHGGIYFMLIMKDCDNAHSEKILSKKAVCA